MIIALIISFAIIAILLAAYFLTRRNLGLSQAVATTRANEIQTLQQNEEKLRKDLLTAQAKLENAIKDPVTGLSGWKLFEDRLNHEIKESERYHYTTGLLAVDIDDFHMINEALGQKVGDALLKQVSEYLQSSIRQVDSIGRLGKDTFIILLTQLTKPEAAAVIAQRILQAFTEPFQLETHELFLTVCIGIAIYPNDGEDGAVLLQAALSALQTAKEKDKQGFHFYQENLHVNSKRELTIYSALKRESFFKEIQIFFQPVMNTQNQSIFCLDALPTWQPPGLEVIDSKALYHYAERQHAINRLTEWLLQTACLKFKSWSDTKVMPQFLGIPVTIKQLENYGFICNISQILQEIKFKPEQLMFVIKDETTFNANEDLEKSFNMLHYMGVKLAIDNFGAGLFSLAQLKRYPIHYLKLDSYLTQDIADEKTVGIIQSLHALAMALSQELIIQNITDVDQVARFKALDCYLMQGAFLGLPVAEHEVAEKLA